MFAPWSVVLDPQFGPLLVDVWASFLGIKWFSIPDRDGEFLLAPACAKFVKQGSNILLCGYTTQDKEECMGWLDRMERSVSRSLGYEVRLTVPREDPVKEIPSRNMRPVFKPQIAHPNRHR